MKALIKKLISDTNPLLLAWHRSKVFVAAAAYGFPARRLTVIGVTGTDGKTTTVGMIAHILNKCGKKTGALSTAFFRVGDTVEWNATQKTSPSPFTIQKFLKRCNDAGCTHVVLECSSHGLLQGRVWMTWPAVGAITNLSEEHLDYHGTMEQYMMAKAILFRMLRKNGTKVLNADDRTYQAFKGIRTARTVSYSIQRTDTGLFGTDVTSSVNGTHAVVHQGTEREDLTMPVAGSFNIQNALCAIGCTQSVGVSLQDSTRALADFTGVPGRMELIDEKQAFSVIVDFTVTPQSYEKTLSTIKAGMKDGQRLLVLTGSCGDRMKEKRPVVGKIVSNYADVMVVANEDPYTEDPEKIIDEVWAGIDQSKTKAHRIFDRKEAIQFLLREAKPGDVVVLCGKGSDTTMWVKTGQIPWNEREIVREMLKQHI